MTKHQKDQLFRIGSLAIVLFIFAYIIISRVGFHQYYKELIVQQQHIESLLLENRKLIEDNSKIVMENFQRTEENKNLTRR